jgi:hypothetical protein
MANFAQQRTKRWRGIAPPLKFTFASTAIGLTANKRLRFTLLKFVILIKKIEGEEEK